MKNSTRLSRLMVLSWDIRKTKKISRSKSLRAVWAIAQNEDITIWYLVKRHSHEKHRNKIQPQHLQLFS